MQTKLGKGIVVNKTAIFIHLISFVINAIIQCLDVTSAYKGEAAGLFKNSDHYYRAVTLFFMFA